MSAPPSPSAHARTALQRKRDAYMQLKLEANAVRARLNRKQQDKLDAELLRKETERIQREEEEERKEAERQRLEYLHKNKEYFELNKAYREVFPKGGPVYYGDNIEVCGAWVPHGHGRMTVNGTVIYEGEYKNGKRDGLGLIKWADGSTWEGEFVDGNAHGSGYFTSSRTYINPTQTRTKKGNIASTTAVTTVSHDIKSRTLSILENETNQYAMKAFGVMSTLEDKPVATNNVAPSKAKQEVADIQPVEALMKNNVIICLKTDLIPGIQVEFNDPTLHITSTHCPHALPRAVLLKHINHWKYLFRLQDEMRPRERQINLKYVKYFRILHELPRIITLSHIDLPMDETSVYDYYMDTFGSSQIPQFGLGLGRKTEEMRSKHHLPPLSIKHRKHEVHGSRNIFESGLAGSDTAKELEQKQEQIEHRKKQWAAIVDQKRILEEEERRKQIEEAQAQIAEQEKEEMERFRAALVMEVEQAMSVYSASPSVPGPTAQVKLANE